MMRFLPIIILLLTSCSFGQTEYDLPLPKIITPTEMYPTTTPTLLEDFIKETQTQEKRNLETGPYRKSEPLIWQQMKNISSFFDDGIPVIKNGFMKYLPLPEGSRKFWDYDWKTDVLAYSEILIEDNTSCSDISTGHLLLHDYKNNADTFIMDRVFTAKWSPVIYPGTNEHLLAVVVCRRQLVILSLERLEERIIISENADPSIAWSPDGLWLSYKQGTNYVIVPSKGGSEKIIAENLSLGGSVFDSDTWLQGHNVIVHNGFPFIFINTNGKETFIPTDEQGKPPEEYYGYQFLWNDETHTLVVWGELPGGWPRIFIYILSEDLHTIHDVHIIGTNYRSDGEYITEIPVAWWIPGESIVTLKRKIWSATNDNSFIMYFPEK